MSTCFDRYLNDLIGVFPLQGVTSAILRLSNQRQVQTVITKPMPDHAILLQIGGRFFNFF